MNRFALPFLLLLAVPALAAELDRADFLRRMQLAMGPMPGTERKVRST